MAEKKAVEEITSMDVDFAKWYTDICRKAELIEYTSVKGCMVLRPYGCAIWENIRDILDRTFKETGHENVYPRISSSKRKGPCQRLRARGGMGDIRRQRKT